MESIKSYPWLGNVRELENKIKRAVIMSNSPLITAQDLGIEEVQKTKSQTLKEARDDLEVHYIRNALLKNRGNISAAANEIGLSRPAFYDLAKKHKIDFK
jgi:two-component system NtrC family response regulator